MGALVNRSITTVTVRDTGTIWDEQGGWFDARWHFSFDRYRDSRQMGVGALRVFNDDRIIAGAEWPLHPHQEHRVADVRPSRGTSSTPTRSVTTAVSSPARRRS